MPDCPRVLSAILAERWAIQLDALDTILTVANRANDDPEAVAAKLGRPLKNAPAVENRDGVAVIPITGPIFRYANLFTQVSGATSVESAALDFQAALDDPSIHTIVPVFDTPGGMVSGISELAQQIRAGSERKRVVGYVSDLAASAGYWLAAACPEIVIADTARLGSIGVVLSASADEGSGRIKFISSQSPRKHVRPDSEEGHEAYQSEVDKLAAIFISAVAAYRGVDVGKVTADFGRGGVLVGADAVVAGMADRVGTFETLIAELTTKRGKKMARSHAEITGELIAAEYPEIAQAFRQEGHAMGFDAGKTEGLKAGAEAERARIRAVEEQLLAGHEALIAELKFDGVTTGPEAAVKVLQAERSLMNTRAEQRRADTPAPLPFDSGEEIEAERKQKGQDDGPSMADLAKQALAQFNAYEGAH